MVTDSKNKSKEKKPRKPRKPKEFIFPNVLNNQNVVPRPNLVWVIDGTELDITQDNLPNTSHYLLVISDPSVNKLIGTKVFFSGTTKKSFTKEAVIKTLKTAQKKEKLDADVLVHSDRGPQFCSKKYFEFINNHKYFQGSMTLGAKPWQNPIAENMNNTFKNLLKELDVDMPSNVKATRDLQNIVNRRRKKMNGEALYEKNNGLTVDQTIKQLAQSEIVEPDVLYARQCQPLPDLENVKQIKLYKKKVRFGTTSERITPQEMLDKIQETNVTTQQMVEDQSVQIEAIGENVNKVLEKVTPKKRITNKAQLLRDPVPKSMLERIIRGERPKGTHQLTWARFQVTASLLFFTGLRISEVAPVDEQMFLEIFEKGTMTFYQPKVNKYRTIRFTDHGVKTIKLVFDRNKNVLFNDNKVIFPLPESNRLNIEKFTGSMNKLLKTFNDDKSKKISSHSFRVPYVSNALKHTSAHNTQKLIGHADIRSTMKYSRHELDPQEEELILKQMFEEKN